MKNKINIIVGTNNFGLGPVGKVSSIVNVLKEDCNIYACGNKFDLNIFEKNVFKDILFSKDEILISKFVFKNDIKYALIVLDVELAKILMKLNVKVIFIDSLPFMWTQADIDEGLLPLDANIYCAQKCINLTSASEKVLEQIRNLKWINPIRNCTKSNYRPFEKKYVLINVGGLHSPIGNGESYIKTVILPILEFYNSKNENVFIACGTKAKKTIKEVMKSEKIFYKNLKIDTLRQEEFLSAVKNSEQFITSPGLTTIYETFSLNKATILLPPQNLSQFYNIEYAKKILNKYKTLDWKTEKLNFKYLNKILKYGETFVVDKIYEYITELINTNFSEEFFNRFDKILKDDYNSKIVSPFNIKGNGAMDVRKILLELIEGENNG